ncbi:MAG: immune inhibitor A [Saprospiraceae bacterium]|nr:immune inhibitor A [Saprospiraceae bacterium]
MLIPDLKAYLLEQNSLGASAFERSAAACDADANANVQTPGSYTFGTMAGYYKYQEMLDVLDDMATFYPSLFKPKDVLHPTLTTYEGRPLYWVKISDNPNTDETDEPEIFFNAVHHAREPNSMSQMIFFMWYLLDNYDTDPEVKYLVDHTEIYFVPCVNPDGYVYNETTDPQGGGFWRKNRRPNDDGTFGVDLNRNYGYQWGLNDNGSSGNPGSEVYRGTAPFSEPETQMVREFCIAHDFQMMFSYHTHGNYLLHSWDYDYVYTPDHDAFISFGEFMTAENNYENGTSGDVLYLVNGGSSDWMYGEQTEKNKILAFVPEVGYAFWPLQADIDRLNKDAFHINIKALRLLHNYGQLTPTGDPITQELDNELGFELKKLGMAAGPLTVSLAPVSGNVVSVGAPKTFNLSSLESINDAIQFSLDPLSQYGDEYILELRLDNGNYVTTQEVSGIFASVDVPLFDAGDDMQQWDNTTLWDATPEAFYSAPSSITDSKSSTYLPSTINNLTLMEPAKVKNATAAYLSFWAKWEIEELFDFAQVALSVNGGSYIPLCGKYTKTAEFGPAFDTPVYDGLQPEWVKEEIDLTEYLGQADSVALSFRFTMGSDEFQEFDGFYFDDLQLTLAGEGTSAVFHLDASDFEVTSRPNPASDYLVLDFGGVQTGAKPLNIEVFNAFGQPAHRTVATGTTAKLNIADWAAGVYYYRVSLEGKTLAVKRFVVK